MKKTRITIRNAFHNTECTVLAENGEMVSHATYNRIEKKLCGNKNCECSNRWKATLADGTPVSMDGDCIGTFGAGETWRFDWWNPSGSRMIG